MSVDAIDPPVEAGNDGPRSKSQTRRPSTPRRRLARWLLLYLGIHLGFCASIAWQTVRPKNARLTDSPRKARMEYESVSFRSEDGTSLSGWLVPAKVRPQGIVVLCHGVDSDRTAMLWKASILHKAGFSTLLFDFRGRGESGPSLCTIGYREVDDLLAAIRFVRVRPELAALPLGLVGESQGGAVVLMGAARSPEVRAVVSESPFARLDHAVSNHFAKVLGWSAPAFAWPTEKMGELLIRRRCCDVSPVDEISKIAPRPVLLIQDGADKLCPPVETAELLKAAGPNAALWTVDGADHIEAEYVAKPEYERRVVAFFRRAFANRHDGGDAP